GELLAHAVAATQVELRVGLVVAQRGLGGLGAGAGAGVAEAFAAVFGTQPQVPLGTRLPVQAGVERMLGRVAQRVAPVGAALLLALGEGVVRAGIPAAPQRQDRKSTRLNS